MTTLDWLVIAFMLATSLVVGVVFARRASAGTEEYFVAGRSLGWLMAGTSMVATTFSSDTPLFVAGLVRREGIYGNWIWWSAAPAALATTFFFAKLWRRSQAVTEVEFVAQRYAPSKVVNVLRVLRATIDGALQSAVIMASVTLAATKILGAVIGFSATPLFQIPLVGGVTPAVLLLIVLGTVAVIYTAISGLYGVVYTDVIQFVVAMAGSVLLAAIVWWDLSHGSSGALERIAQSPAARPGTLDLVPDIGALDLPAATFLILVTFGWVGYAPSGSHFVQRMLATRSERDAMLSMYWYTFCQFVLRSWPWVMVGLASLVYLPDIADAESAYPTMINRFLPAGLKGVMVASLMAAFMSTATTQMNCGASYLVNDVYRPFIAPTRSPRHYVTAGRVAMLALTAVALILTTHLDSILAAYKYLAVMVAGNAFVLVARWYWWRVNVWTEIISSLSSLCVGGAMFWLLPDEPGVDRFALRLAANLCVTTVIAIAATLFTSSVRDREAAKSFHRRLRIGGPGWLSIEQESGVPALPMNWSTSILAWLTSIALVYALLFGLGFIVLQRWSEFALSAGVAVAMFALLRRQLPTILEEFRRVRGEPEAGRVAEAVSNS